MAHRPIIAGPVAGRGFPIGLLGADAGSLDLEVWPRLAAHEEAGRLALRLRAPFHAMHAKLYLWQTAAGSWQGVSGSSNLTQAGLTGAGEFNTSLTAAPAQRAFRWFHTHWQEQSSRRAPQVWAELGADGLPETEIIVPSRGVPARRGLAVPFEGRLGSTEYRLIGAILLFSVGVVVFAGVNQGWWAWLGVAEVWALGVGIGLMILAGDLLRRGRRRSRRSRG